MTKIIYDRDEIKASGRTEKPVNSAGNIYIGREFAGCYVEFIILKKQDSEPSEIEKPDPQKKTE